MQVTIAVERRRAVAFPAPADVLGADETQEARLTQRLNGTPWERPALVDQGRGG
jgi:hypothetical protein